MSAISRWLDRFCYKHPNFGIPNLMKIIALGNVAVFLLDMFSSGYFSQIIRFFPELILRGEVWRLVTFVFVPINSSPIWFVLSTFLYYYLGNSLEQRWGSARFTLYYALGIVLNVVVGLLAFAVQPITADLLGGSYYETANLYYINMSLFFAFATLYPDTQFLIYFIIPVKVKWLAWLDGALFVIDIIGYAARGQFMLALLPVVAVLNYLVFFWDDLMGVVKGVGRRAAYQVNPQTINFKKATRQVQERRGYLHKCAVCGITDADDPDMEFRYCSKCNGYYCYCMNHINNHTHVQ